MRPLAKFLKDKLTAKELEIIPRSYDVVGSKEKSVAIVEIPKELEHKKKLIAEAIMISNKSVKSVLNKKSGRKGTFRLIDLELIAGEKNTEVIHREHGYMLKLDPRKVFFSPREATERQRIASLVEPDELVAVLFSGVAPYPICIAKKQPDVDKIYAIEINKVAHNYAKENVRVNKLSHKIILINDDVEKFSKKSDIKFDRIVMPIAVGGENFLDEAFKMIKDNCAIHFYSTGNIDNLFSVAGDIVKRLANKNNKIIKIENRIKMLPFGVRSYKICLDIRAGVA